MAWHRADIKPLPQSVVTPANDAYEHSRDTFTPIAERGNSDPSGRVGSRDGLTMLCKIPISNVIRGKLEKQISTKPLSLCHEKVYSLFTCPQNCLPCTNPTFQHDTQIFPIPKIALVMIVVDVIQHQFNQLISNADNNIYQAWVEVFRWPKVPVIHMTLRAAISKGY